MAQIDTVIHEVSSYAGSAGAELVEAAYSLGVAARTVEACSSPVPPLDQVVAAARILAELENRPDSVAAALLVDLSPDSCSEEAIREHVGEQVAQYVTGVRQMRERPYLASLNKQAWSDRERSGFYHVFVDSLEDPQPVLIELAHQLSRLRHIDRLPPADQGRLAAEVQQIYAPLAHRLGIWRLKGELEDRAFRVTGPGDYRKIADALNERLADREAAVREIGAALQEELDRMGITAQITGRPKHIHSIYRKMRRKGVSFDAIYDVRALRVLVDDVSACYQTLGAVHRLWTPVPGEFDDYVAAPKANGYQSLHTAVTDGEKQTLEVQIRTHEMHRMAELGIAAHWRYKERRGSKKVFRKPKELEAEQAIDERISWLRSLLTSPEQSAGEQAAAGPGERDRAAGFIFVFTPDGDMIRLPAGSTPIDFAYRIHTELGHRCYGAKVNSNIVPLNHQLITGDAVEIITRKRGGPNIDWLSQERGFVRTRQAKRKISAWFRRQRREENVARGHEILERELSRLGVRSSLSFDKVAKLLGFERTDEMLAQIGAGEITRDGISSAIAAPSRPSKEEHAREAQEELVTEQDGTKTLIEKRSGIGRPQATQVGRGLQVASTAGVHSHLAKCCYPVPPEQIVGYVTRGHGVTIHLADCPNVDSTEEKERIISASWGAGDGLTYPVMVVVEALNRRGLMGDIGQAVSRENTDISEAKAKKRAHWAVFELLLEVTDAGQLARVLQKLAQTDGVREVYRKKG